LSGTQNFYAVLTDVGTVGGTQLVDIPLGSTHYDLFKAGGTTNLYGSGITNEEGVINHDLGPGYKELDIWAGSPRTLIHEYYQHISSMDDFVKPVAAATIALYVYKVGNPNNPTESIGSTLTDEVGYWEYNLADFCWSNGYGNPFMVTYKRNGTVKGHRTAPDHFWLNAAEDGYLPIMVENNELTT